jgi:hypothetical protein
MIGVAAFAGLATLIGLARGVIDPTVLGSIARRLNLNRAQAVRA